jgi:hypothetical protein
MGMLEFNRDGDLVDLSAADDAATEGWSAFIEDCRAAVRKRLSA